MEKLLEQIETIEHNLSALKEMLFQQMSQQPSTMPTQGTKLLLTPRETAKRLGVAVHTLSIWRMSGEQNLPYIKVGRGVRYSIKDVDKWLSEHVRMSTK